MKVNCLVLLLPSTVAWVPLAPSRPRSHQLIRRLRNTRSPPPRNVVVALSPQQWPLTSSASTWVSRGLLAGPLPATSDHVTTAAVERGLRLAGEGDLNAGVNALEEVLAAASENWVAWYALSKILYLARRDSKKAYRARAEVALLISMHLRPERVVTDASLVPGPTANCTFAAFSCTVTDKKIFGRGKGYCDGQNTKRMGAPAAVVSDVRMVRALLKASGFDAPAVRSYFGLADAPDFGVGVMMAKRIAAFDRPEAVLSLARCLPPLGGGIPRVLDTLIRLFVIGMAVDAKAAAASLGVDAIAALRRLGMLADSPRPLCSASSVAPSLFPHGVIGLVTITPLQVPKRVAAAENGVLTEKTTCVWIATDWAPPVPVSMEEEPVMYLGPGSISLLRHLPALTATRCNSLVPPPRWLDMCCGSGVQGVVAAASGRLVSTPLFPRGSNQMVRAQALIDYVDVNVRALRFAGFNSCLNRAYGKVGDFFLGDLYSALPNGRRGGVKRKPFSRRPTTGVGDTFGSLSGYYDVILANPPYVPVPPILNDHIRRYDVFSADPSGAGDGILKRIVGDVSDFLGVRTVEHLPQKTTGTPSTCSDKLKQDGQFIGGDCGVHSMALRAVIRTSLLSVMAFSLPEQQARPNVAVVIMRGISGSGKSTAVARVHEAMLSLTHGVARKTDMGTILMTGGDDAPFTNHIEFVVCSADTYFVGNTTGQYTFDRRKLQQAHAKCFNSFLESISAVSQQNSREKRTKFVVVDNTNSMLWEYEKYIEAAKSQAHASTIHVLELNTTLQSAASDKPSTWKSALTACAERNLHGVSFGLCSALEARWEQDSSAVVIPAGGVAASTPNGGADSTRNHGLKIAAGATTHSGVLASVTELPNPTQDLDRLFPADLASARCAVVYDAPPSTAEGYTARRSGRGGDFDFEARAWAEHLQGCGLKTTSNSIIFWSLLDADSNGSSSGLQVRLFPSRRAWSAVDASSEMAAFHAARWAVEGGG